MTYSLGEVQALAVKAARGAGYSWGLAEEAGRALRWCVANQLDGVTALASLLVQVDQSGVVGPARDATGWRLPPDGMCPLAFGTAFADFARLSDDTGVLIPQALAPVLVLPFLADAARRTGRGYFLAGDAGQAMVCVQGVAVDSTVPPCGSAVRVAPCDPQMTVMGKVARAAPRPEDWETLLQFAARTYAPATEASRRLGAG